MLRERNLAWEDNVPEIIRFGQFATRAAVITDMPNIGLVTRNVWNTAVLTKTEVRERVSELMNPSR